MRIDEKNNPQVYLEECKYKKRRKRWSNLLMLN